MNIAILIYPQTWFHVVLGLIDALPITTHIDAYVCNEHNWVGLLKQSYQNGILDNVRKRFQIFNIDNFNIDNQYDYVMYSTAENMIKHKKCIFIRDWLPIPTTDKLFPIALPKKNKKKLIGVVGTLTKPLKLLDMNFVFINFVGSSLHFPGEHFHLDGDAFYLQVANCDYLFPTDLSDELSIVCKVPLLYSSTISMQINIPIITEKNRRFEIIHLINDNPLSIFYCFDKVIKKWKSMQYNVKLWDFDDLLQLVTNVYPNMKQKINIPGFLKKLVIFHESGLAPNIEYIPINHDGYWDFENEIINNIMIGSITKYNTNILESDVVFTNNLLFKDVITQENEITNQYEPWVIVLSCIFIFLLICFSLRCFFLRKNFHSFQKCFFQYDAHVQK